MRRDSQSPDRPRWLALLFMTLAGTMLAADASAQNSTRITRSNALDIQEEALSLLATPRVSAMSTEAQSNYIENYVLYAFARDAGLGQAAALTPAERDQAQRLIGAVLEGTTSHDHATAHSPHRSDYSTTQTVVEMRAPRYVYVAPPSPPPIVFVPAPAPLYYLSPAPVYLIPARHHKWGW